LNKKIISGILIALFLILTLTSTSGMQTARAQPSTTPATSLRVGLIVQGNTSLDPAQVSNYIGFEVLRNIGSGLVDLRPGSRASMQDFIPALATSWSVSSDNLTWTFNLRQGVKFGDGTEFNASDVKYTLDRDITLNLPQSYSAMYSSSIKSIEVTGKYQVEFNLTSPFAPLLALLTAPYFFIVNPSYAPFNTPVAYVDGNARASNPMDLGPYTLTQWNRTSGKDIMMRLDANPSYWNASTGCPLTKTIIIKFYDNSTALRQALEADEVDIALAPELLVQDVNELELSQNFTVWAGPMLNQYIVFQDNTAPFNNPSIRRAVAAAINRTALTQNVFLGQAKPLYSMIPDALWTHIDAFKTLGDANYTFTISTLATLGYSSTSKLKVDLWYETSDHYPQSAQQAQALKVSLEASGVISVTLHGLDWADYRKAMKAGTMPVSIVGWSPDYPDPDEFMFPLYYSTAHGGWLNDSYASPQMDMLLENARSTTNATVRNQLYAQIQQLAVADCPIAPTCLYNVFAVSKPNVEGIYSDITGFLRLWLVALMWASSPTYNMIPGSGGKSSMENGTQTFNLYGYDITMVNGTNVTIAGSAVPPPDTGNIPNGTKSFIFLKIDGSFILGTSVIQMNVYVNLTKVYALGIDPYSLKLYSWNVTLNAWEELKDPLGNPASHFVYLNLTCGLIVGYLYHLSYFAVLGTPPSSVSGLPTTPIIISVVTIVVVVAAIALLRRRRHWSSADGT
jgi:peptide/nickel transport system substrate-binding protein